MKRERIFVHLPFKMLDEKFPVILEKRIQPEFYIPADVVDSAPFDKLRSVKEALEDAGLSCTIHAPFYEMNLGAVDPLVLDAVKKRYERFFPFVEILSPKAVVIHTGYDRWRYNGNVDLWMSVARRTLSWIDENIPKHVKICVENVFDEDPAVLCELLEEASERIGVCFDVGHFHLFSRVSLEEWLLRIGEKIKELHIHDNDAREDRHWKILSGSAPILSVINWAKDRDIIFTLEVHDEKGVLESYNLLLGL